MIAPVKKTYAYYPGCSLIATNKAYDISTRNVARVLGMDMIELEDWNCCGATAYMAIREKRSFVLSARNLALAEKQGRDLVTACAGCYLSLHKTNVYMDEEPKMREDVRKALKAGGMDYTGSVKVRHMLDVLVNDLGEEEIKQHVVRAFGGLKVAPYCGCQITRPFGDIDDPEFPVIMHKLLSWIGAEPVPFLMTTKCCGGMLMVTQPEVGEELVGRIILAAKDKGAECISTACPLCQINLEAYQAKVSRRMGKDCSIPVLYFTQLLGITLGLEPRNLALRDNLTPTEAIIAARSA
ncbi:MAG: CoB--CoM heterodisulfide reductase iron-sulfur subunit B family protein [Candidatus Glassbacteria bacterium]|nr:CoB--CoM heterodisulfide reductase iron-sulfur subunit B family protein [Candidatus Glassbacteria bacterium]